MLDRKSSIFKRIDNFVRGVANGLTFGAADYIAAVADTWTKDHSFRSNLRNQLQQTQDAQSAGSEYLAGEVIGAVVDGTAVGVKMAAAGLDLMRLDIKSSRLFRELGGISAREESKRHLEHRLAGQSWLTASTLTGIGVAGSSVEANEGIRPGVSEALAPTVPNLTTSIQPSSAPSRTASSTRPLLTRPRNWQG